MSDAEREAYERGYSEGARYMEDTWPVLVEPAIAYRPDNAELELRRWGPGGRERFGERRPEDRFPRAARG